MIHTHEPLHRHRRRPDSRRSTSTAGLLGLRRATGPTSAFRVRGSTRTGRKAAIVHIYWDRPMPIPAHRRDRPHGVHQQRPQGREGALRRAGLKYDLRRQAGAGTWQLFSHDPNGAKVELDFDAWKNPSGRPLPTCTFGRVRQPRRPTLGWLHALAQTHQRRGRPARDGGAGPGCRRPGEEAVEPGRGADQRAAPVQLRPPLRQRRDRPQERPQRPAGGADRAQRRVERDQPHHRADRQPERRRAGHQPGRARRHHAEPVLLAQGAGRRAA